MNDTGSFGQRATRTFTRLLIVESIGSGARVRARRQETLRGIARRIDRALAPSHPEGVDEKILVAYLGGLTELVLQHIAERPVHTIPELVPAACAFTDALFFPRARRRKA